MSKRLLPLGSNHSDTGHSNIFLDMSPEARETKAKINYWAYITIKSLCTTRKTMNKTKRQLTEWEKIFAKDITDKGLVCKIYKELIKLNTQKTNNPIKNGQKTWIDISPKKTSRWPTDTWKHAQYHLTSGKCKSRLQWDITSHL